MDDQLIVLIEALEDVEWARNSGDGSVPTASVDRLTEAVHRYVGAVRRQDNEEATEWAG